MKLNVTPLLEGDSAKTFSVERDERLSRTFVDLLDHHKALLVQSPDGNLTANDFGQFVVDLQLEYYPYIGGAAPRSIIPVNAGKDIVFTANER
jgi:hypothetical protein